MENSTHNQSLAGEKLSFDKFREEVLKDYRLACESREASLLGRKEVLTGKAKFGIFGDGKEVAQIAASKFFQPGDFCRGTIAIKQLLLLPGRPLLRNSSLNCTPMPTTRIAVDAR